MSDADDRKRPSSDEADESVSLDPTTLEKWIDFGESLVERGSAAVVSALFSFGVAGWIVTAHDGGPWSIPIAVGAGLVGGYTGAKVAAWWERRQERKQDNAQESVRGKTKTRQIQVRVATDDLEDGDVVTVDVGKSDKGRRRTGAPPDRPN